MLFVLVINTTHKKRTLVSPMKFHVADLNRRNFYLYPSVISLKSISVINYLFKGTKPRSQRQEIRRRRHDNVSGVFWFEIVAASARLLHLLVAPLVCVPAGVYFFLSPCVCASHRPRPSSPRTPPTSLTHVRLFIHIQKRIYISS